MENKIDYSRLDDEKLEDQWQLESDNIRNNLNQYYSTQDENFRTEAVNAQGRQVLIQREITKREKLRQEIVRSTN